VHRQLARVLLRTFSQATVTAALGRPFVGIQMELRNLDAMGAMGRALRDAGRRSPPPLSGEVSQCGRR
jgi:hypothetical protein